MTGDMISMRLGKQNKLLNDLYLNDLNIQFLEKRKYNIAQSLKSKVISNYQQRIDNKDIENIYEYKQGYLDYFFSISETIEFEEKVHFLDFIVAPKWNNKQIKELIQKVKDRDRDVKTILLKVPLNSIIFSQLIKIGATDNGTYLLAAVKDTLSYLQGYKFDNNTKITELNTKNIDEVVELEYYSHQLSKTSRGKEQSKKHIKSFYAAQLRGARKVFISKENGVITGVLSTAIDNQAVGYIMTIAVLNSEQGRGISKLLYLSAMRYFVSKRVKLYAGVTTTNEVLSLSKRMKRVPISAFLKLKGK